MNFKFSLNWAKTLLLIVIVIVTNAISFAQKNNFKTFHGTILAADNYKAIPNANIININSGIGARRLQQLY